MATATLLCDETGNFGDATREADRVNLVGGIVVPRIGQAALERRWAGVFQTLLAEHDVPLHATEIRDPILRAAFTAAAATAVREAGGIWLFLRAPPAHPGDAPFSLYLRALEAWVDLATRLAWSAGADKVDIVPAQRTVPLPDVEAQRAIADQAGQKTSVAAEAIGVRAMVRPGVRVTVEQIAAEGGPAIGEVRIDPAATSRAHPGINLCDFGCAAVRHALKNQLAKLDPALDDERVLVVVFEDAVELRAVARAAREHHLDLVRLSNLDARFAARSRGAKKADELVRRGAARASSTLRAAAVEAWAGAAVTDGRVKAMVSMLAGTAAALLEARQGDYEGLWSALHDAWAGAGPLAKRARGLVADAEHAARLERLVLECANHRGDVAAADAAWNRFVAHTSEHNSLVLLAESLVAANVRHVALQNRLPAKSEEAESVSAALVAAATELVRVARVTEQVIGLAEDLRPAPVADSDGATGAAEAALWATFGRTHARRPTNREVGRCFGSAARTWAFLGDHAKALDLALDARACFGKDAGDLQFNANVLLRILCDDARVGAAPRIDAIRTVLPLAAPYDLRDPDRLVGRVIPENPGVRFAVDCLLRCLLWAPAAVARDIASAWSAFVRRGAQCPLYRLMTESLRSHPSELIARHAGELSSGDARRAWLDLSVRLSEEAGADTTLGRFAPFTRALQQGVGASTLPGCSELNPTFEYR